jgi:hypothetical protein
MRGVDIDRLGKAVDELGPLFYGLMSVSLLAFLVGALGSGALLLIFGGCVQVVRGSCEEFAAKQRGRANRARPVVVRSTRVRALPQARQPRRSTREVAVSASRR